MPKKSQSVITSAKIKPAHAKPVRNSERVLKTVKRDQSRMMTIKVDKRTTLVVPIGTDVKAAIRKYENRANINPPRTHALLRG